MPLSMIVVTTSWAPVFTFRIAGIAAQAMPPSIAKISDDDDQERAGEEVELQGRPGGHHHRRR